MLSKRDGFLIVLIVMNCFGSACVHAPQFQKNTVSVKPLVLWVSLDGFRPSYLGTKDTPCLQAVASQGASAAGLVPIFPSLTFPSHYAMATGLYADEHGIIANSFLDFKGGKKFELGKDSSRDPAWWEGEPIWVTLEKMGRKTAPLFWVGAEVEIQGVRPTYWKRFDGNFNADRRLDLILNWIDPPNPSDRPEFATVYFENVDSAAHRFGISSQETHRAIQEVDQKICELRSELDKRGLSSHVDLIVVSDHGMVDVPPSKTIDLSQISLPPGVVFTGGGAIVSVYGDLKSVQRVYSKLNRLHSHLKVYKKDKIPKRFHYSKSKKLPEVLILADEGWRMTLSPISNPTLVGVHGYDPQLPSMHGIFLAVGPHFKERSGLKQVNGVDVHALTAFLLGVQVPQTRGRLDVFRGILR